MKTFGKIYLNKNDISTSIDGADANREFLNADEISASADLLITETNQRLEIFCDWKKTWEKYGNADFRYGKFKKLKNENSLILGISPKSNSGFLLDTVKQSNLFEYNQSIIGYGGKPGYTINGVRDILLPISYVKDKLISIK